NIRSADLAPGDDYGMMREVLTRRFKRLMAEAPRAIGLAEPSAAYAVDPAVAAIASATPADPLADPAEQADQAEQREHPWPDLVLIDGGEGQLAAARETLGALGVADVPMVAIAKGPDRDAGRETFHMPGRDSFKLPPRDPVLYFVQRLRDEAHRFAIG